MNRTTWRLDTVTRRTCEHGREVRVGGQVWLGVEGADAGATTNPAARCPEGMEAKPLTSSSDFHYLPPSTSYLNHHRHLQVSSSWLPGGRHGPYQRT